MKFEELNLNKLLIKATTRLGFSDLTPIQEKVLPVALQNCDNDIIAQAPTGTGKTIAYGLPILNNLNDDNYIQALILAPTRELANQIKDDLTEYAYYLDKVNVCALYGGEDYEKQFRSLKKNPKVIVATPGRLLDHIKRGTVNLANINTLVLDEADEMLDMGFRDDINEILLLIGTRPHAPRCGAWGYSYWAALRPYSLVGHVFLLLRKCYWISVNKTHIPNGISA